MKKVVFNLIDSEVKDCLLYGFVDGVWIINPDTKEWIIHIGPSSRLDYLWFNYEKFKSLFKYVSLDIFKDKYYIKDWAEDRLKLKIGSNYHPDITPGDYNWSDDFKPEKVIESGVVVGDFL
jgi:hypothetical protein